MRKINKKHYSGTWVKYPEDSKDPAEFLIRPISIYTFQKLPSEKEGLDLTADSYWEMVNYILLDWKGVGDEDGNELECNLENKKAFSAVDQEASLFLINKANEIQSKTDAISEQAVKNLPKSPVGEIPKSEK